MRFADHDTSPSTTFAATRSPSGAARRPRARPRPAMRSPARPTTRNASGLDGENQRIGGQRRARTRRGRHRPAPCRRRRRAPNASACAAPHRPMRVPSRSRAPCAASPIIEPIAADREDAVAKRQARTRAARSAPGRPPQSRSTAIAHQRRRRGEAAGDRPKPQRSPSRGPPIAEAANRHQRSCPASTPPCCRPASLVVTPGVMPNTSPAKGSTSNSCAL